MKPAVEKKAVGEEQIAVLMPAREAHLFSKLKPGEPRFTLRAGDISAALTVEFWASLNQLLRRAVRVGKDPKAALDQVRARLSFLPLHATGPQEPIDEKLTGAFETAEKMRTWPSKKVAD